MFKKIIILLITILLLTSCSSKKEPVNHDEEQVIEKNEIAEEKQESTYSSWIIEGDANYISKFSSKIIKLKDDNVNLLSPDVVLLGGTNYHVSFDCRGEKETKLTIQIYDETGEYINQNVDVTNDFLKSEFDFYCGNSSYQGKVKFIIENNKGNTIDIDNFSIDSDTNKTYAKINQVGYLTNLSKKVVLPQNSGDYFNIYNLNNEIVYIAPISETYYNKDSDEYLQTGYFSEFKDKGTYYIKSELGAYSKQFVIDDNVYDDMSKDALRFIYTQRCGQEISKEVSSEVFHNPCHTYATKVFTTLDDIYIDTVGGWHDASDYGRYVQTANKTIADLLFAYLYTDNKNIDTLNEARYGIEWVLKLQKDDGSVYNKITSKYFAENVLPEYDNQVLYAMRPWTLTTASFAGVTGLAYKIYKDTDANFAEKCLIAHQKAIDYLKYNKDMYQELNPDDFGTGEYRDSNESDERLFAYAVAYDISGNKEYYNLCKEVIDDGLASDGKDYNCRIYAIVTLMNSLKSNDSLYKKAKNSLVSECDILSETIRHNTYSYTYENYNWGSNSHLCDACNKLIFAYKLLGEEKYKEKASEAIDYVMGLNSLNLCFVYGYGYAYPSSIHHRIANVRRTLPTGALAGGVDQIMSDGKLSKYIGEDVPIAKRFVDVSESYTNVEPAVYYNSSLVLTLNLLNALNEKNDN